MATGVEELLDMLFEMIDEAKSMPLSSDKCILERDKALDLLDEIRAQFPMELAEAKKLIAARTEYIASAKREGELIRKRMEAARELLVSTPLRVQEVSRRCGYTDQHYFSYCFKKYSGESPNALRRRLEAERPGEAT